jgi:hypothetical protein
VPDITPAGKNGHGRRYDGCRPGKYGKTHTRGSGRYRCLPEIDTGIEATARYCGFKRRFVSPPEPCRHHWHAASPLRLSNGVLIRNHTRRENKKVLDGTFHILAVERVMGGRCSVQRKTNKEKMCRLSYRLRLVKR